MKGMVTVAGGDLHMVAEVHFYYLDLMQPNSFPFHASSKGLQTILF